MASAPEAKGQLRVELLDPHLMVELKQQESEHQHAERVHHGHDHPEQHGVDRPSLRADEVCGHHGLAVSGEQRVAGSEYERQGQDPEKGDGVQTLSA